MFSDTDPVRAQKAVTMLASMFIQTRLRAEFQRNEYTSSSSKNKPREYEAKYGETQASVVSPPAARRRCPEEARRIPAGSMS
jgi:hypothetical protein